MKASGRWKTRRLTWANGTSALANNTIGNFNTAYGNNALFNNTTGNSNIALGDSAGINTEAVSLIWRSRNG